MAPTPRNHHLTEEAGLHSEEYCNRSRGRRYFHVATCSTALLGAKDTKGEDTKGNAVFGPEDHAPNAFCRDTTQRAGDDYCGLSSREIAACYDVNHRRSRRHICHGLSKCHAIKTPSTPSVVSEPISEDSAQDHLGHRDKVKDERWKEYLEKEAELGLGEEEPIGGATSHHLCKRHGRLGFGKRHFGPEYKWVGYHRARRIDDPGGEDAFDGKFQSFLGPQKRMYGQRRDQQDDVFCDEIQEKERHTKKMFHDHFEPAVHASEEVPLGVSSQIDLHTRGFLGKSKHNFGGMAQISHDPISDFSTEHRDPNDLSCYGLNHRGKRKFLVQNNLDSSCRHNMSRPEARSMPTLRCSSMPILERPLPPNETPYYQDDLPESARAIKPEIKPCCRFAREVERNLPNRSGKPDVDSTWSAITWTPRKVDAHTAAKFIEGQDSIHGITDEEHCENEMRNSMGKTKRSFGNAHNKSNLRFDYGDPAGYKAEHHTNDGIRWGAGHGRRMFEVNDHLDDNGAREGIECYTSVSGAILGRVKPNRPEDLLSPRNTSTKGMTIFMDSKGNSISPRHHKPIKDNVTQLMNDDVQSEDSNMLGVTGMRRKTETMIPKSARRFPQKDHERVTPRSATPRARSEARIPLVERPLWKK